MATVKDFDEFIRITGVDKLVAGVAVVWNNHILLVRPTDDDWKNKGLGIPKGKLRGGENVKDGAIRELEEETGIKISPYDIEDPKTVPFYDKSGKEVKSMMIYFEYHVDHPSQIGMNSTVINKDELQKKEIDWAGFIPIRDAYSVMNRAQLIILDRLS